MRFFGALSLTVYSATLCVALPSWCRASLLFVALPFKSRGSRNRHKNCLQVPQTKYGSLYFLRATHSRLRFVLNTSSASYSCLRTSQAVFTSYEILRYSEFALISLKLRKTYPLVNQVEYLCPGAHGHELYKNVSFEWNISVS